MLSQLKFNIKSLISKQQSGFSLIEVLMAVAIVATGMLAYGSLSGSIMTANTKSTKKSIAITLAQDKIEELRNLTLMYQDLSTALNGAGPVDTNPVFDTATAQWIDSADESVDAEGKATGVLQFTRTWTMTQSTTDASTGGGNHLFDAQVIVSWNNNGQQSVTLESKISD